MEQVTLTIDPHGDTGLVLVPINDILYISYVRKYNKVAFYTGRGTYYGAGTKEYWTHVFNNSGATFRDVDRNNSVNVERISRIDTFRYVAYFERFRRIGELKCTMSESKYNRLVKEFPVSDGKLVPTFQ